MAKPYSEMTLAELSDETLAWWHIISAPKGPGTPSNAAREGAETEWKRATAWEWRRLQEAKT